MPLARPSGDSRRVPRLQQNLASDSLERESSGVGVVRAVKQLISLGTRGRAEGRRASMTGLHSSGWVGG